MFFWLTIPDNSGFFNLTPLAKPFGKKAGLTYKNNGILELCYLQWNYQFSFLVILTPEVREAIFPRGFISRYARRN